MNIFVKTIFLLHMQSVLIAQNLEDIDYVTEMVEDVEDTTEVEEVAVVTTPMTTSAEPLIEDDLVLSRSESEADTVLLEPPAETDDNLELNSNNIVFMTQTPSGTGSDNSETDGEVAIPMLAVEEDVVNVEADVGTPKLVEEDVDTKEADSETLGLAVENEVIETDIAYIPEIDVEENVDIEEVDVSVPQLPGGWFYFRKSGASPLYQTFQTFPGWKSGYQRMPWHYPRRWPARPIRPRLNNEVGDETNGYNTKLSPSYHPFYAFRKISH